MQEYLVLVDDGIEMLKDDRRNYMEQLRMKKHRHHNPYGKDYRGGEDSDKKRLISNRKRKRALKGGY